MKKETQNPQLKLELLIVGKIIEFYCNSICTDYFIEKFNIDEGKFDELKNILVESQREWEALPCDKEGATKEQNTVMDEHLEKTAEEIINLI